MGEEMTVRQRRDATWIIVAQSFTKLGDVLTNPKTVLTWMLSSLGAPGAIVSMLVPVRESGSMLPQLFVSGWVKRVAHRKWVYVAGALAQALAVAGMGASALLAPPGLAGVAVLLALILFALARAFCSISSKDVLGRTVPKGFRGRVGGVANTVSGLLSAAAALVLVWRDDAGARVLAWVVLGASLAWVLGAVFYALVDEPGGGGEGKGRGTGWRGRMRMVWEDPKLRGFVTARTLLLGSALASPVLVVLGRRQSDSVLSLVGFMVAAGIASALSSFLWGKLADRAAHRAMAGGGWLAAAVGGAGLLLAWFSPAWSRNGWVWPLVFLLFNFGYAGVRMGRKTWVVDAFEGDRRTDAVAASNTVIAALILVIGAAVAPLQAWSPIAALGFYSLSCLVGGVVARGLGHR